MTVGQERDAIQQTKIYYLDASNPLVGGNFGTGDLVVNGTGTSNYGVSWLFLSGTADGVGPTNPSTSVSVNLTTWVNNWAEMVADDVILRAERLTLVRRCPGRGRLESAPPTR
jgi:hypothetical protein